MQSSWYEQWFGEEYLRLYPHRNEAEARNGVELILGHARLPAGALVLDLACGAGRHLREFVRAGAHAVGLDLSSLLLRRALAGGGTVVRGDMRRLPFRDRSFSLVCSFFTSFGYFSQPEEDVGVLREVRRVLHAGGSFAFDFLNADQVRAMLPSSEERWVEGRRVSQVRSLVDGGRVVEKRIEILGPDDPIPHIFYERVRLYSPDELTSILADAGLRVNAAFGGYTGDALRPDSPRVILIGKAS